MDHAADPCVDFFQYACGTWNKKNIIPEDRSSISTFEVMADQLQIILKGNKKEDNLFVMIIIFFPIFLMLLYVKAVSEIT